MVGRGKRQGERKRDGEGVQRRRKGGTAGGEGGCLMGGEREGSAAECACSGLGGRLGPDQKGVPEGVFMSSGKLKMS